MSSHDLSSLVAAALRVQRNWEAQGIEFCFIGGLAVQYWGEPRQTNDVDATVWTEFGNERPMIDKLLEELTGRIEDAAGFALINRVLLAQERSGIDIDISFAAFPFENELIGRSQKRPYVSGVMLRICEPSDLVILKAFANRARDWQDIRGILIRSGKELDWGHIESVLSMLARLKEEPEIMEQLSKLRDSL